MLGSFFLLAQTWRIFLHTAGTSLWSGINVSKTLLLCPRDESANFISLIYLLSIIIYSLSLRWGPYVILVLIPPWGIIQFTIWQKAGLGDQIICYVSVPVLISFANATRMLPCEERGMWKTEELLRKSLPPLVVSSSFFMQFRVLKIAPFPLKIKMSAASLCHFWGNPKVTWGGSRNPQKLSGRTIKCPMIPRATPPDFFPEVI